MALRKGTEKRRDRNERVGDDDPLPWWVGLHIWCSVHALASCFVPSIYTFVGANPPGDIDRFTACRIRLSHLIQRFVPLSSLVKGLSRRVEYTYSDKGKKICISAKILVPKGKGNDK
jgi:hypothetical protein